jgi:hypothetical protein
MSRIEQPMPQIVSRQEPSPAAPGRAARGGRRSPLEWVSGDFQTLVKPEDVARGEVFFNSTCFWI